MKLRSFLFLLLIVIIVTSSGCLESKKSPVPNETKNATLLPNLTEQEQPVNNETKLLTINDTFETWSRGYRSNISGDRPYFKVITNYSDWNEFLDNQDPWYIRKKHAKLEGQLFPGLNIIPRNISPDDFNNYFIMAAMMGEQGGTGPEIEIKNISMSNNIVNVTVRLYIPSFGLSAQSYPYDIVIVKRELLPDRNSTFVFMSTEGKELEKLKVENK